jgi:hypothetical protein
MFMVHFGFCFNPIVHQGGLHFGDRGPLQPEMRISLWRLGITDPFVGDSYGAGKTDLAVHNQQLPVRAMIHAR